MIVQSNKKHTMSYNTLKRNYESLREEYFILLNEYNKLVEEQSNKGNKRSKKKKHIFKNKTKFPDWFVRMFRIKQ